MITVKSLAVAGLLIIFTLPGRADAPVTEMAQAVRTGTDWRFEVTLSHPETGWEDYADGWRVETEDGVVLGTRVLVHPHVNEQPFTRSLTGVTVPQGISRVYIRARTNTEGWFDDRYELLLP